MIYKDSIIERPDYHALVNRDNYIGKHMSAGYILNNVGIIPDITGRFMSAIPDGTTNKPDVVIGSRQPSVGRLLRYYGETDRRFHSLVEPIASVGINPITNLQSWSIIAGICFNAGDMPETGEDPRIVSKDQGFAESDHTLMIGFTSGQYARCRIGFGGTRASSTLYAGLASGDEAVQDGTLNLIGASYDGATMTMRLLRNGKSLLKNTAAKTGDLTVNNDHMKIGMNGGAADNWTRGNIHFVYFINTCLDDHGFIDLFRNPYQVIRPRRYYNSVMPTAAAGITIFRRRIESRKVA